MSSKLYSKLFLVGFAIVLVSCGKKEKAQQAAQAMPYPTVKIESKKITGYKTYPTSIEGVINSGVRAKISGYIKDVLVDEGQQVSKGQVLFRLETESLTQDAGAAQASVNVAQVEVDKLKPLVEKGIISEVLKQETKAVEESKQNPEILNYLVGKVMQKTQGKADPELTLTLLKKNLGID